MTKRAAAAAVLSMVIASEAGCSFGMQKLPDGWDGTSEPQCSNDPTLMIGDALGAGVATAVALAGIEADSGPAVGAGLLLTLPFIVGGFVGESRLRECREAKAAWRVGGAIGRASRSNDPDRPAAAASARVALNPTNDPKFAVTYWCSTRDAVCSADESACEGYCNKADEVWCSRFVERGGYGYLCGMTRNVCLGLRDMRAHRKGRTDFGECVTQRAAAAPARVAEVKAPPPPTPAPPSAPAPPRGFFCSSSAATPAAGFCTREKSGCQQARDAAIVAVTDLAECQLVEAAFCFTAEGGDRCAPTAAVCASRASSASGVTAPCDRRE